MTRRCMDCKKKTEEAGPDIVTTGLCDECLPARLESVRRQQEEREDGD